MHVTGTHFSKLTQCAPLSPPCQAHSKRFRSKHAVVAERAPRRCEAKANISEQPGPKVVGLGGLGTDYLAQVAAFPAPDQKIRTEDLKIQGGGNCANALTGAARLGLRPVFVSKIGADSLGDTMLQTLEAEGVDTSGILRAPGKPSPFSYIIVDRAGGTRTSIHTAGDPLMTSDMTSSLVDTVLRGSVAVAFFDGRFPEAALELAKAAKSRGIPILVEAERLRDGLPELLQLATYVTSSTSYPRDATGESSTGAALVTFMAQLPHARWVACTQGSRGSIILERGGSSSPQADDHLGGNIDNVLQELWQRVDRQSSDPANALPGCVTEDGASIGAGATATCSGDFRSASGIGRVAGRLRVASAAALSAASPVVDTTGAGDAFSAALLYGLATGMSIERTLVLGGVVAACNCTALGARSGMPRAAQVDKSLLT